VGALNAAGTGQVAAEIAHHGAYAVFALMALDTVLPLGGELTMLYAGVLTAGATGARLTVLGAQVPVGVEAYAVLVVAGTLGSLAGALVAYGVGAWGGRALISPDTFERGQAWLERHGRSALFFGRLTPVVRSFISIPAGVLRTGFGAYALFTLLGSLVWCLILTAVGWGLSASWQSLHHGFRYADYAAVAAVLLIAAAVVRRRRGRDPHRPSPRAIG
jgi:membrane protein DedA with SNARE-associated domain